MVSVDNVVRVLSVDVSLQKMSSSNTKVKQTVTSTTTVQQNPSLDNSLGKSNACKQGRLNPLGEPDGRSPRAAKYGGIHKAAIKYSDDCISQNWQETFYYGYCIL